jgi:opacity protein-like surface antigen
MTMRTLFKSLLVAGLAAGFAAAADDTDPAIRRPSFGIRIESFGTRMFSTKSDVEASTTKPIADYTYSASSSSPRVAIEPTVEYRLLPKLSISAGLCFHHAQYQQVTEIKTGTVDPNSGSDDRKPTTITESTKANYWEFPVLAHYYGLRPGRWWSRAYVSAGVKLRHVGRVRTGTDYANADGTTDYNEIPAVPGRSNQLGFVAGAGLRLIDSFNIKMTPEVRFIRWQGVTFQGLAYRSMANQVEVGVGFSF